MGTLSAEWSILPSLFLAMEAQLRSSQRQYYAIPAPWQGDYPGYAKLNGNLRYQPSPGWSLALGTRNLTDRRTYDPSTGNYAMPAGLPTRGREVYATLNARF